MTTESSSYLLDLTGRTATCFPGTGADIGSSSVAELRRDADAIWLLGVTCTPASRWCSPSTFAATTS